MKTSVVFFFFFFYVFFFFFSVTDRGGGGATQGVSSQAIQWVTAAFGNNSTRALRHLCDNDELAQAMATGVAFPGFQELESPRFPPTYKRRVREMAGNDAERTAREFRRRESDTCDV